MVELGFGGGSNPTPPTQTHIPTDPTLPKPIYNPSPTPSPNPTLPFLSLPYQTPPHAKPPHPIHKLSLPLPYPALLCPALGKTWNGLEWNSIMSSLKEHSLFIYNLPHNKPNRPSNPNSPDLDPHPPDHDPPPDIDPLTLTPRL